MTEVFIVFKILILCTLFVLTSLCIFIPITLAVFIRKGIVKAKEINERE